MTSTDVPVVSSCPALSCSVAKCRYVEAEILNHRMLRHPHVIEFREVFITSEYICIAMEFASGGSLFTYVQFVLRLQAAAGHRQLETQGTTRTGAVSTAKQLGAICAAVIENTQSAQQSSLPFAGLEQQSRPTGFPGKATTAVTL